MNMKLLSLTVVAALLAGCASSRPLKPGVAKIQSTAPASLAANKMALLTLDCFGTTEAAVVARYQVES